MAKENWQNNDFSLIHILINQEFIICSLTFDQEKKNIFVFSVGYKLTVKENLENLIRYQCIYVPCIFCEKFLSVHANFFK